MDKDPVAAIIGSSMEICAQAATFREELMMAWERRSGVEVCVPEADVVQRDDEERSGGFPSLVASLSGRIRVLSVGSRTESRRPDLFI